VRAPFLPTHLWSQGFTSSQVLHHRVDQLGPDATNWAPPRAFGEDVGNHCQCRLPLPLNNAVADALRADVHVTSRTLVRRGLPKMLAVAMVSSPYRGRGNTVMMVGVDPQICATILSRCV
jgi:hypothetical protein